MSVSAWLARAADARVRRVYLGAALDAFADEHGSLSDAGARELVARARDRSVVTRRERAKK